MTEVEESVEITKESVRSDIILSLIGEPLEKREAIERVGYYYLCHAPKYLFKYYSDKLINYDTVKDNKMWYSAPCCFNDIFDCDIEVDEKALFESFLKLCPDKRGIKRGSPLWMELKGILNKEIKGLKASFEELKKTTGIACLSESNDSLLMWAHYANNHRGFCVEYDLLRINELLHFSPVPVIYDEEKTIFDTYNQETEKIDSYKLFIHSLTSKSPEWSYEREWRIIRDDGACGEKWDYEKHGALLEMIEPSSIIIGCMATREFEKNMHSYCEEKQINLYRMRKDEKEYSLKKVAILEF